MAENEWLATEFESHRPRLRAVAWRMLGSRGEAEDAVQEAWLRLARADAAAVENLGGWLTTVVSRVCLDLLRSRRSRREEPLAAEPPPDGGGGVAREVELADSIGPALLVVLDTLAPAERLAFVLHDLFAVPFEEIAAILERSPAAARQLASRARRRVRGAEHGPADAARKRRVVEAFLAASRDGNLEALLALLAPGVVLRADAATVRAGAAPEVLGAAAVAETFKGRARFAELALVDGAVGAVWAPGGQPRVVFAFAVEGDAITGIELLADPERLRTMELVLLPTTRSGSR